VESFINKRFFGGERENFGSQYTEFYLQINEIIYLTAIEIRISVIAIKTSHQYKGDL